MNINDLKSTFKDFAKRFDYLYDFYPETLLKSGAEYYSSRLELIKYESKYYIRINEDEPENVLVQMMKFQIWDDTIDEVDSSWVDEKVVFEIVTSEKTIDQVVDEFLDQCRQGKFGLRPNLPRTP